MRTTSLAAFTVAVIFLGTTACTKKKTEEAATAATSKPSGETPIMQTAPTELVIEDVKVGTGKEATTGKNVTVHYTGWLKNGTKFDSSLDRGEPFNFPLGQGRVIQGWDKGVAGMKEGGTRKLTIPPHLGYGSRDMGVIPPESTLVFEVKLLKVN